MLGDASVIWPLPSPASPFTAAVCASTCRAAGSVPWHGTCSAEVRAHSSAPQFPRVLDVEEGTTALVQPVELGQSPGKGFLWGP